MQFDAFRPGRKAIAGSIAAAVAALAVPNAFSADRVVLGEFFTWIDCPPCEIADPVVETMVERYGPGGSSSTYADRLALLTLHLWDAYEVPWGTARENYYIAGGIFQGTPCFVHDAMYDAWPIDTYEAKFLDEVADPSDMTMSIYAEQVTSTRYNVTVEACLEAGAAPVNVKIYTVLAEDHVLLEDYTPSYHIDDVRDYFRSAVAPTVVSLEPGECVEVTNQIITSLQWNLNNLVLIAWAQEPDAAPPALSHQAAIDPYPWEPAHPPCPWDCQANPDGVVGVNDFLQMLADWGTNSPCDFDGGGVGVADFLALLANWGTCPE